MLKMTAFWDTARCSLVEVDLHLQGDESVSLSSDCCEKKCSQLTYAVYGNGPLGFIRSGGYRKIASKLVGFQVLTAARM
jgi:hypothetical protein